MCLTNIWIDEDLANLKISGRQQQRYAAKMVRIRMRDYDGINLVYASTNQKPSEGVTLSTIYYQYPIWFFDHNRRTMPNI